LQIALQHYLL